MKKRNLVKLIRGSKMVVGSWILLAILVALICTFVLFSILLLLPFAPAYLVFIDDWDVNWLLSYVVIIPFYYYYFKVMSR